jgi:hypothetical protein
VPPLRFAAAAAPLRKFTSTLLTSLGNGAGTGADVAEGVDLRELVRPLVARTLAQ